jgi:hypothetical protein
MTRLNARTPFMIFVLSVAALVVDVLAGGSACVAQEPSLAIGFSGGDTFGVSWKLFDPDYKRNAYEATVGWTVRDEDAWELRWMYQRTAHAFERRGGDRVELYAGAGLRVKLERDTLYSLRTALGLTLAAKHGEFVPEVFIEAAPTRDLSPRPRWTIGLAAGVRWRL